MTASKLTRIGVFYDGNYFYHVSNYYNYHHSRRSRISIGGLHDFIRHKVADSEGCDVRYCHIVDAHYFRGRLRAQGLELQQLVNERNFDDVLIKEGVVTHYLPITAGGEKGIDVWLALEAFELAVHKRFDVVALIAGDGDFVPLLRKLNTMGTRVMLLSWDFKYVDQNGNERETRTSQSLLDEATYPMMMHQIIDDRSLRNDPLINGLFVPPAEARFTWPATGSRETGTETGGMATGGLETGGMAVAELGAVETAPGTKTGRIQNLREGYGFITPDEGGENLFFYWRAVVNTDFNQLQIGDAVSYDVGSNDRGPCAVNVRRL